MLLLSTPDNDALEPLAGKAILSFLHLPIEIQDLILRFAVTEDHPIIMDSSFISPNGKSVEQSRPSKLLNGQAHQRAASRHPTILPPITLVDRRLRNRSLPFFYRHNTFVLVIRHTEAAHRQHHLISPPLARSTQPSHIKDKSPPETHRSSSPLHSRPPLPDIPSIRFIRRIETDAVMRRNLHHIRIRHIFRRVDFEVEFECFVPRFSNVPPSAPPIPPPAPPPSSPSSPPRPIHDPDHNGSLNYRITRVLPHSADGWVYGYVRRARLFLMLYNRPDRGRARGEAGPAGDYSTGHGAVETGNALGMRSADGDRPGASTSPSSSSSSFSSSSSSSFSSTPWRKLVDVKGLVRYDWNAR
jgi:hypothetical protein